MSGVSMYATWSSESCSLRVMFWMMFTSTLVRCDGLSFVMWSIHLWTRLVAIVCMWTLTPSTTLVKFGGLQSGDTYMARQLSHSITSS